MSKNLGFKNKINKNAVFSLSLILMLSMSLMITFVQTGLAQVGVTQPEKTAGYISIAPTLIGVGQNATVNLWVFPLPSNYGYQAYYGGFTGATVTFIKPDGTTDTFMPVDGTGVYAAGQITSLGSLYFFYKPDMAGNWSVSFTMPAQNLTDSTGTVLYQACTSKSAYFTVTKEEQLGGLLNGYPWGSLPDKDVYWSYPINSNNREWSAISGDWLQGDYIAPGSLYGVTSNSWQPYGSAPDTAHIVWKQPIKTGGLIGGDYGSLSYENAFSYAASTIMDGKAFTNIEPQPYAAYTSATINNVKQFKAIDLATGEVLYTADGTISCGIHLPGNPAAQSFLNSSVVLGSSFGSTPQPYLFGGASYVTWEYYDPFTGALLRQFSNVSTAGYRLVDGTNIAYGVTYTGNLFAWDLTKVKGNDWPTGITWSTQTPTSLTGAFPSLCGISTDVSTLVLRTTNEYWGCDTKNGTVQWHITLDYPVIANEAFALYGVDGFVVFDPVAATFNCYSMKTGALLWKSDSYSDSPWATTWTVYNSKTNDYENLYLALPDGTISALSLKTGKEVWRSEAIASTEYTNNAVPYVIGMIMVGGNIYAYAGYSIGYQINPIPRFAMLTCTNATTGETTFTLNGGITPCAAANGYVIGIGQYDENVYCLGKGQTSTSVTIQNNVIANHATALITGNVLDQSLASAGTPAVADASMSEWMDYLHMQNTTLLNNPPTPQGVTVTLTAVDPNGNTINIGTTTTDSKGNYAINFAPENVGIYTIKAAFAGTNSYYSSDSETQLSVTAAPEATTTATPIANPPYEMYTVGMGTAVIVVVLIATVLLLRKKP